MYACTRLNIMIKTSRRSLHYCVRMRNSSNYIEWWDKNYTRLHSSEPSYRIRVRVIGHTDEYIDAQSHITCPYDLLKVTSVMKRKAAIVALVNNKPWDLGTPLYESCVVEFCDFQHPLGYKTFMHSSAHILGQAMQSLYDDVWLSDGPPLPQSDFGPGFHYDMVIPSRSISSSNDFENIKKRCYEIIKTNQRFLKLTITKKHALELFHDNPLKIKILNRIDDDQPVTIYRCGNLVDLCRGPHIQRTGQIKIMEIVSTSTAGTFDQYNMQRIYAIAFPVKSMLTQWEKNRKEAKANDHRGILLQNNLIFFHSSSPGNVFLQPHGTRLYNCLKSFIRNEYRRRGYDEVMTPLIYNQSLWKQSGHWNHYKKHMFTWNDDSDNNESIGLKPMNCPGHCVLFSAKQYSYRDLPIRYADFSPLHRNEDSGNLTGLTRLRRFTQDDAHIFCTEDQLMHELKQCFEMIKYVYGIFQLPYRVCLSTRPSDGFIGDIELWNKAETYLRTIIESSSYTINEGDGAFYGPKVDIIVSDALGRQHQCATIQLDFQLPQRFELRYRGKDGGFHTPVLIHRAILGSFERCIALLTEHYGGKYPLWLSPRQILILPVNNEIHIEYAEELRLKWRMDWYIDIDYTSEKLPKKIKRAHNMRYNYMLIIGDNEVNEQYVTVRSRDMGDLGQMNLNEFDTHIHNEVLH